MDWLVVTLGVGTLGLGGLAVYRLLNARLRRQEEQNLDAVLIEWSALLPAGGFDVECGIDVVNTEGKVVGIALVRAPALN